jgi:hypothetical protein
MPVRHSSVVGGSSAARVINCPGSKHLLAQVPIPTNRDSFYSTEGTALHTAMEMLITRKTTLAKLEGEHVVANSNEVEITASLIQSALMPAMAYWADFLIKVDHWVIEAEVEFPGIKGAFGTADVIGRDDRENITYVSDWKFGAGKGVQAEYDGIPNEQLMFYACAARNTYPGMFPDGCRIVLTIVQPRARDNDPITSTEVTLNDLDEFEDGLEFALTQDETHPGRWCDFQACRTICPHHTGPLLDLSKDTYIPTLPGSDYMPTLLKILEAAPIAEKLIKEARAQAHLLLAEGSEVPGWKLVAKRGTRQWNATEAELPKVLGVPKKDLYDAVLKSPAKVEKELKKKIPTGAAVMVSSGTTLAPAGDKRPAISASPDEISEIMIEVLGEAE